MRRSSGLSLLELLIALAILSVILGITYAAIVSSLRVQSSQEAATSSQAKLRRITEVFTQELRSAVLGAISNQPYSASASSVSFTLLDGGAGYQVLPHDSGNNASFQAASNVQIIATADSAAELEDSQALMVNANGEAVVFDVTTTQLRGSNEWNVVHPGCANTIEYTPNTLLFKVRTIGLQFDATDSTIYQREGSSQALPLAFDLSEFRIDYVYVDKADGSPRRETTPYLDANGNPARNVTLPDGTELTLARLQLVVSSERPSLIGPVTRSYAGQIELASNNTFNIQTVAPCN